MWVGGWLGGNGGGGVECGWVSKRMTGGMSVWVEVSMSNHFLSQRNYRSL